MIDREIAISLNFKWYPDRLPNVFVFSDETQFPKDEIETHILVYEDMVMGWFLDYGKELQQLPMPKCHHAGFVVLQIAMAQIEGIEQYTVGKPSEKKSRKFFIAGMKRIFPWLIGSDDDWLGILYDNGRCALFHDGTTRGIHIENRYAEPLKHDPVTGDIEISPNKFLDSVCSFFVQYVTDLKNSASIRRRSCFEIGIPRLRE